MDIYTPILDFLVVLPLLQTWAEMQTILKHAAATPPRDWQLPVLACEAVGGTPEQAIPAAAAIACQQISIILIDDLLDADPRGEHRRIGAPAAANLAAAFQAAGLEAIAQSEVELAVKVAALRGLNQVALTTALGQHWDTQNLGDEASYWRVVETKSSPFFGAALFLGALFGGAPVAIAERLRQVGLLYGEMIQIHDDLNDSMAIPANPDWGMGRSPLPILFAQIVDHPDRERFLELRPVVSDPAALAEAQTILIRCGAVSYGVDQLLRRCQKAQETLRAIPLASHAGMDTLLEDLVKPVRALFETMGVGPPEAQTDNLEEIFRGRAREPSAEL